jgi:sec-independent protein translocase protein TatC
VISPTPEDEAALDATKAPLMEHLIELRKRLIWGVGAFGVAFVICFAVSGHIFDFLTQPLHHALAGQSNDHLIYTALTEVFFMRVKIGMFGGLCLGFPFIAAQLWLFIAPGLYRHEKNAFLPFLVAAPVMFAIGAAFVYYVMLPFAIQFFTGYQVPAVNGVMGIELQAKVDEYLTFVMTLMVAFGITFQLPVVLSILARVGIVNAQQLRDMRRYAIVALVALAAVFTPPDPYSMISLAVPLVALYEISILCVWFIQKGRAKTEAEREAARDIVSS